MRRIIGHVCQYRYKWHCGQGTRDAFVERFIEIWYQRNDMIGLGVTPVLLKLAHHGAMPHLDHRLKKFELSREPECEAMAQSEVV